MDFTYIENVVTLGGVLVLVFSETLVLEFC
jgi:hypothetical protein